jgi:DNA-binding transcriptional regulator YhcF (GntR family)
VILTTLLGLMMITFTVGRMVPADPVLAVIGAPADQATYDRVYKEKGLDRPIYVQIADRVKFAVASGVLRPGDLVPSVRELSKGLVVNPNTVSRAYRELQAEGLLEPVRGTGLQVAEGAAERCRDARVGHDHEHVRAAVGVDVEG